MKQSEAVNLYRIIARGCRDTYVVSNDLESAVKLSKLREEAISKIEKVASQMLVDDKTGLLVIDK